MNSERILTVLKGQHISAKSLIMADKYKQFTFKVLKSANKQEIKQAVEMLFTVKVKSVSVMNIKGKRKQFKQRSGKRRDWKKAFVSLHADFDINFSVTE